MPIKTLAAVVAHAKHILNRQISGKFPLKTPYPLKTQKNQFFMTFLFRVKRERRKSQTRRAGACAMPRMQHNV